MKKEQYEHNCPMCKFRFEDEIKPLGICGNQRPPRDVLCQLPEGHEGRHQAVIFWE